MVEKMREIMKSKPKIDIQRREIAEFMGVTPALVGYYFPDKRSLIEEAASPLIDEYIAEVRKQISASRCPFREAAEFSLYIYKIQPREWILTRFLYRARYHTTKP